MPGRREYAARIASMLIERQDTFLDPLATGNYELAHDEDRHVHGRAERRSAAIRYKEISFPLKWTP